MKKILLIILVSLMIIPSIYSQNNIGIFIGGGFSDFRLKTDERDLDKDFNKEELNFAKAYHAGFNFENVLIERLLYLQFGIHARSSGYSAHNDSVMMFLHNVHIPLELKYKYFFNKRGESYLYVSGGPYISVAYKGLKYDQESIDRFLEDTEGYYEMYNPKIKLGKSIEDDIDPIDYGVNAGLGFGYSNLQIGYNFGFGISNIVPSEINEPVDGEEESTFILRNGYHTLTLGFYFSNN